MILLWSIMALLHWIQPLHHLYLTLGHTGESPESLIMWPYSVWKRIQNIVSWSNIAINMQIEYSIRRELLIFSNNSFYIIHLLQLKVGFFSLSNWWLIQDLLLQNVTTQWIRGSSLYLWWSWAKRIELWGEISYTNRFLSVYCLKWNKNNVIF